MYLLNWRLWVGVALLAAFPLTYMKGRTDGTRLERAQIAVAVSQADHEARATEERRQDHVVEAQRSAATRASVLAADAASARGQLGGMSVALDAAERAAKESSAAADQYRAAARDVLLACSRELQDVAAKADGHANDVRLLLESWPK